MVLQSIIDWSNEFDPAKRLRGIGNDEFLRFEVKYAHSVQSANSANISNNLILTSILDTSQQFQSNSYFLILCYRFAGLNQQQVAEKECSGFG
jgi:hypothetical protein